jgi:hypothetical protein
VAVHDYIHSCDWFYKLKSLESLSRSFENEFDYDCRGGCRRNITGLSAYEGCQHLGYRWLQLFANWITQDARLKSVVTPSMFIVKMGEGVCSFLFGA